MAQNAWRGYNKRGDALMARRQLASLPQSKTKRAAEEKTLQRRAKNACYLPLPLTCLPAAPASAALKITPRCSRKRERGNRGAVGKSRARRTSPPRRECAAWRAILGDIGIGGWEGRPGRRSPAIGEEEYGGGSGRVSALCGGAGGKRCIICCSCSSARHQASLPLSGV